MDRIITDFVRDYNNFHKRNLEEYESIQTDSGRVKLFRQKFRYFDPKNKIKKPLIHEMFACDGFEPFTLLLSNLVSLNDKL